MNWLTRLIECASSASKSSAPEGLWIKCPGCNEALYNKELERSHQVCPKCGYHHRIGASDRARALFDEGAFEELDVGLRPQDPLAFKDTKKYADRIREASKKVGPEDALRNYFGSIKGHQVSVSIFEFGYMGGSMGSVVGEKIVRGMERSLQHGCPYLLATASGGARMQEGILSLMQMAKTSATAHQLNEAKLPFVCLLTDPTMGGVSASVAWLGDVILAEPNALIGFAGPRVIQETVGAKLPEGFQRAEFLLQHGLIDAVVGRLELRDYLSTLFSHLKEPVYRH